MEYNKCILKAKEYKFKFKDENYGIFEIYLDRRKNAH